MGSQVPNYSRYIYNVFISIDNYIQYMERMCQHSGKSLRKFDLEYTDLVHMEYLFYKIWIFGIKLFICECVIVLITLVGKLEEIITTHL